MAISDAFSIDYTNKRLYHNVGDTVFTVNVLYSYLQDTFDELNQMDDPVPITAQTPTEYTLVNGWFMGDSSTEFLSNGAISTIGYTNEIQVIEFRTTYSNAVQSDIGKYVWGGSTGDSGILLYFDNTQKKWWVRRGDSGDAFDSGESISVLGGTGTGTSISASSTGEELYANIFTLGTIADNPFATIYIFQDNERVTSKGTSNPQWWSRGQIDVLIKVEEAGQEINEGLITVFARQYGDLYDHFDIDLSAGGRNAVPLATGTDLNNTLAEKIFNYTGESTDPYATLVLKDIQTGATAEIIDVVEDRGDSGTLRIGHFINGLFNAGDSLTGYGDTFIAEVGSSAGDTPGDTGVSLLNDIDIWHVNGYLYYDGDSFDNWDIGDSIVGVTSGATAVVMGDSKSTGGDSFGIIIAGNIVGTFRNNEIIETGTATGDTSRAYTQGDIIYQTKINQAFQLQSSNPYNIVIDLNDLRSVNNLYEYTKFLSRENSSYKFYTPTPLTRKIEFSSDPGAVDGDVGGQVVGGTTGDTGTLLNFDTGAPYTWTVRGGDTGDIFDVGESITILGGTGTGTSTGASYIDPHEGQEYIGADHNYVPSKQAPLGTFAGGVFFGARGVWLTQVPASDAQNYQLIDANGTTQSPPNFQSITVTAINSGDRIGVFRTTGANFEINKSIFTGDSAPNNTVGDSQFVVLESIPNDTPSSGVIRVVDRDANGDIVTEDRLLYDSFDQSSRTFFLNASTYLGDSYNEQDTAYVPFIDEVGDSGGDSTATSVTVIYTTNRNVAVRVRKIGILPFQTQGIFGSSGLSVAAIKTNDSIVVVP